MPVLTCQISSVLDCIFKFTFFVDAIYRWRD